MCLSTAKQNQTSNDLMTENVTLLRNYGKLLGVEMILWLGLKVILIPIHMAILKDELT